MEKKESRTEHKIEKGNVERLGAVREGDGVNFTVAVKTKEPVSLLLYKKGTCEVAEEISFSQAAAAGDVRALKVLGLKAEGYEYNYRIGEKVVQYPCARLLVGQGAFGEKKPDLEHETRCGFDTGDYDWEGDVSPGIAYQDAVMYTLHVRGFSMQPGSGVRHRGTFKGVQEKAEYFKELGINQVKLMPAYEFEEIIRPSRGVNPRYARDGEQEENTKVNYWGYGPGYYFAPKAAYAATAHPAKEFRDMVRTLHRLGIEVLMDICFAPETDYRMAAGCLMSWITNYHVDGFHLVGNQRLANILARDPLFTGTKLLGEYFPPEEAYPDGQLPFVRNLGEYNDGFQMDMRRLLKGDENQLDAFVYRLRRNPDYCGVINYISDHNGFTLMDAVSYEEKHNEANGEKNQDGPDWNLSWNCGTEGPSRKKKIVELRLRQIKNALVMLLLSAGTPMLQAGDEFGNSQGGNNNPYCQDNETGWVDWKCSRKYAAVREFTRELIAFRMRHRILHMERELRIMDTLSCGYPDLSYHGNRAWFGGFENGNRQVGVMYCGEYAGEDCFVYAAYNLHWIEHEFALPHLPDGMVWYTAIDTSKRVYPEGEEPALEGQKMFKVPERTIIVLIGRK